MPLEEAALVSCVFFADFAPQMINREEKSKYQKNTGLLSSAIFVAGELRP